MKLWEVLKALEENPKKVFECSYVQKRHIITADERGYLHLEIFDIYGALIHHELGGGGFNGNVHVSKMDWQEVKQPVTWQEAIKAWANGKTIKCEVGGLAFTYNPKKNLTLLDTLDKGHMCASEITEGTWYIED